MKALEQYLPIGRLKRQDAHFEFEIPGVSSIRFVFGVPSCSTFKEATYDCLYHANLLDAHAANDTFESIIVNCKLGLLRIKKNELTVSRLRLKCLYFNALSYFFINIIIFILACEHLTLQSFHMWAAIISIEPWRRMGKCQSILSWSHFLVILKWRTGTSRLGVKGKDVYTWSWLFDDDGFCLFLLMGLKTFSEH